MSVHFNNIDKVIATIRAATIKNKDHKKDFHDTGLPSSPDPVITGRATWLRAALYYNENLPAVRTIVNNWTSAGFLFRRAEQKTPSMRKIWCWTTLKQINNVSTQRTLKQTNQLFSCQRRVLKRKCLHV